MISWPRGRFVSMQFWGFCSPKHLLGMLIVDEIGLGKTLQLVAIIATLAKYVAWQLLAFLGNCPPQNIPPLLCEWHIAPHRGLLFVPHAPTLAIKVIAFNSLVAWIAKNECGVQSFNYVDDSFGVETARHTQYYAPYNAILLQSQSSLLSLWDELGIPHKWKKHLHTWRETDDFGNWSWCEQTHLYASIRSKRLSWERVGRVYAERNKEECPSLAQNCRLDQLGD